MRSRRPLQRAMDRPARILGSLWLTLLLALLPCAAAAQSPRVVSNVATIVWEVGPQRMQLASNRVDIQVSEAASPTLAVYRLAAAGTAMRLSLQGASCRSGGGEIPFVFRGARSDVLVADVPVREASSIRAGEPIIVEVALADANTDASSLQSLPVTIRSGPGEQEALLLVETGADTGRFVGAVDTSPSSAAGSSGDCSLAVAPGSVLTLSAARAETEVNFASSELDILADPFGIAFDSDDGAPVSGARITIVDAATGQPAQVFGDDGVSAYPSTIVTGSTVTDASGRVYPFPPGDYRFPLMRPGRYRLVVEPPSPYLFPSNVAPADLAGLSRPEGGPFAIVAASFGEPIVLDDAAPVQIDIPLDRPRADLVLAKTASRDVAERGDAIQYRITIRNPDARRATGNVRLTDIVPAQMRLRPDSVRLNGDRLATGVVFAGNALTIDLPAVSANATAIVTYLLDVRPDAREGDALNRVEAVDSRGARSNVADALVRISRETIAGRMTIVGRVVDGGCSAGTGAGGIAGVRIMLEDGSYAVTDKDGRYHFDGVVPGTHVVQLDDATLPLDRAAVDCARNVRSGGRAFSRFVDGSGGALKRVDFWAAPAPPRAAHAAAASVRPEPASDAAAAGAERDWLTGQQPGIAWLFPAPEHNPRAPVVRVAIKHAPGQTVRLFADGRPVDPIAFDGTRKQGNVAVSLWRAIPLEKRRTLLTAEIRDGAGALVETLERPVHYAASPMQAELLRDRSVLIADGVTRPVIALRMTDRDGRPVHHGLVGDFEVPAPYYPAVEADAQQARQLAGLERARPVWRVVGDEGIAYVELEPTTASGTVSLRFRFQDGETVREQRVETWLDPGDRPWTIVGLAEGTIGYNKLNSRIEELGDGDDKVLTDGRLALYAKGRIAGKWLMTLAYDSDKKEDETRFGGVIDPQAYYTVYADRSERRYDAASVRKLYLKLERPQFYALFGDYETGIDEPELSRYVRALNGVKAEYRSAQVSAVAFAADTPNRHRRDEIQGNGLTGPYPLRARDILANSERVSIEVRDRLRSDRIVDRRLLTRHIDYDIDYAAGTLRFREPILSRTSSLDPQFIVADYEVDGIGGRELNAGARASWRSADQKLQVAATAIHDKQDGETSLVGGVDVRYRPSASSEVRAEVAVSDSDEVGTAAAWQVEAEHHSSRFDVLAYARERERGFGVGQTNAVENGTRKIGFDGRARLTDSVSITGSAWHEDYLGSDARRIAGRALIEYRGRGLDARAGITIADDRLADGRSATSNIVQLGATKRLLDNRLELDAQTEIPVGGKDESIDFPARHRVGARYALTSDVSLIGAYEIADGEEIDARTLRAGFDLKPWAGARIALTGNVQDIAEYGPRSFAAFGLSQSLVLDKNWSVDFSLDSNQTIGGFDPGRVLDPLQPIASGGYIGDGTLITEDFTAVTAGATYRSGRWSVTGRAEYRAGDLGDRYGVTAAALRQIGEGSAVGGAVSWFTAEADGGAETRTANLQLSWAHRPADSEWSWLDKLELREDRVEDAVVGVPGPIGVPLTVSGDARSRRLVNSLSINWSPSDSRAEASLFWGTRYVSERFGEDDVKGWSNVLGADLRFSLSDLIEIGASGTVRQGTGGDFLSYSAGPTLGIRPFDNGWLAIGWNIVGFSDRDFEENRYSRNGPYVTMRFKFDQMSLAGLGLDRP